MGPSNERRCSLPGADSPPFRREVPGKTAHPVPEELPGQEGFGWAYIRSSFGLAPLGNGCVALALLIGFYQGWLKRKHPGMISTFAYDIPLMVGLVLAWCSVPARRPLFPDSRTAIALKVVLGICMVFLLIPTDVPWLIRFASFRGWTLAPLMFLVGYHILKTPQQLRMVAWWIVVLSVLVTIYGMRQNPAEILSANVEDEGTMRTVNGSTYARSGGGSGFRVFSTFVGAGMFAVAVAIGVILSVAEITDPTKKFVERLVWGIAGLVCLNGILISGTRSALITAIIGSATILWFRGNLIKMLPAVGGLAVAGLGLSSYLGKTDSSRIAQAFSLEQIYERVYIVTAPSIEMLLENPIGRGLGHSTHGVPVVLSYLVSRYKAYIIDGDLGHAAVDLGLVGMVAYIIMMIWAARDSALWTRSLNGTRSQTVAIMSTAMFATCLPSFITGSPFLHVPAGAIVWYFIGGLNRVYDDRPREGGYRLGGLSPAMRADGSPVPPPRGPVTKPVAGSMDPPCLPRPESMQAKPKRFLYR
jgi:hypothetical protein